MKSGKSFIRVKVTTQGINEAANSLILLASSSVRKVAIKEGAQDAKNVIEDYYRGKGRFMWLNLALPTHGAGRKQTQWWRGVANNWFLQSSNATGATIRNSKSSGFAHKVTGGTIRAKRKRSLTIPLVPEAHGLTARTYSKTISPLFRVKNCLAQADPSAANGIKPVFALVKSVTQKPWPNALPPETSYVNAFMEGALDSIIRQIE
jgi:hypothetical protein